MPLEASLADFTNSDPTWQRALAVVQTEVRLPSSTWLLIRSAWNGSVDSKEFIRMLGFSHINLSALIDAAGLKDQQFDAELLDLAIRNLGVRFSSVVIGINTICNSILAKKPPPIWRKLFQEMMTWVEIGYKMGSRITGLGVEGGSLIGFSKTIGHGLLLGNDPASYRKWAATERAKMREKAIELFGCEPFQVSAFALQQLGFGHEIAIGAAIGAGTLNPRHLQLDERILMWKAALLWIEALREGRNYPASMDIRDRFPEIAPPKTRNASNMNLDVLYTEVARVKKDLSLWTWHLPKPGYEETMKLMEP